MSKLEATHRSTNGKWLYRVDEHKSKEPEWYVLHGFKEVYFWDEYCGKWRPSIMFEDMLIKI